MKRKSLSTLSREPYPGSLDVWTWNMETEGERRRLFWIRILNSDFDAWEFLQLPFKNGVAQATAPAPGSKKNIDGKKSEGEQGEAGDNGGGGSGNRSEPNDNRF